MKSEISHKHNVKLERPKLWAPSPEPFWNDEHISKSMLAAHLNPGVDAASRKTDFIDRSVCWIADQCAPATGKKLLDLGCGPGLYAEKFHSLGFKVFGIDLSPRSIAHAKEHTAGDISYLCADYLDVDFPENADAVTMIYCDYGVLPPDSRRILLAKARNALRSGGSLFLDVFTPCQYSDFKESGNVAEYPSGGFWSAGPHTVLEKRLSYPEDHTYLHQVGVISGRTLKIYHIWEHVFTPAGLRTELLDAGFAEVEFYGDISGAPLSFLTKTLCAVARK